MVHNFARPLVQPIDIQTVGAERRDLEFQRLAFGLPRLDRRIVGTGLAAKLVQDVLPGFHRRLLAVRETRFLESTH